MNKPLEQVGIAAIARGEHDYIEHWLEWHHELGCIQFHLWDNDQHPHDVGAYAHFVNRVEIHGESQQMIAYRSFKPYGPSKWWLFIDLDEHFICRKDWQPTRLIEQMHWICIGGGKQATGKVTQDLRTCMPHGTFPPDGHLKSMIHRSLLPANFNSPHAVEGWPSIIDISPELPRPQAAILHYLVRYDWRLKVGRIRADNGKLRTEHECEVMDVSLRSSAVDIGTEHPYLLYPVRTGTPVTVTPQVTSRPRHEWDESRFNEMVRLGTAAWKDVPDDWLEQMRSGEDE